MICRGVAAEDDDIRRERDFRQRRVRDDGQRLGPARNLRDLDGREVLQLDHRTDQPLELDGDGRRQVTAMGVGANRAVAVIVDGRAERMAVRGMFPVSTPSRRLSIDARQAVGRQRQKGDCHRRGCELQVVQSATVRCLHDPIV